MNFVMILALLATTQNTSDIKALDFNLVGSRPVVVVTAPPAPPSKAESRPPVVTVPVPKYTKTMPRPSSQENGVVRVRVQDEPAPQSVPQQWFQNPDGSYYRVVRRYSVPAPSTQSYVVPYSGGGSWGAAGACGPGGFSSGGT